MREKRRVVVTGIGVLSPIGNSMEAISAALKKNQSGIRKMPEWDGIENLRSKVAGVCEDVDEKTVPRKYRRTMGRVAILSAIAAIEAVRDSGLDEEDIASEDCGVSFGSTEGSTTSMEKFFHQASTKQSLKGLQSSSYLQFMSHTCAANLAVMFQAKGPLIASCTACTAGSQGIGFGYEAIKQGRASVMITGGAEEMHFMNAGVFDIMRATSTAYNEKPDLTPRPFDRERDGLVVGEGAACLVLEDYGHAKKRDARMYAEIRGFGNNCDGSHLTSPGVEGLIGVMNLSLKESGLTPLEFTLNLAKTFGGITPTYSFSSTGPGTVENLGDNETTMQFKRRVTAPGLYVITVDDYETLDNGTVIPHSDTVSVMAEDLTAFDLKLKQKWAGLRSALSGMDVNNASCFFDNSTMRTYAELFIAMPDQMPQMAQDMSDVQLITTKNGQAEYDLRVVRNGKVFSYYLQFVKDKSGLWKIKSY